MRLKDLNVQLIPGGHHPKLKPCTSLSQPNQRFQLPCCDRCTIRVLESNQIKICEEPKYVLIADF